MKFLFVAIALCISCLVLAQEGGVQIQQIERIPMGDGTIVYRYALGDKKHLEGECRLAVNEREYVVANFKNGLPEGKWETYRYNKLYEKRNYKNGKLDGNVITYDSDGKIVKEFTSSNGKRNGRYTTYFTNGQLQKEQEYKDGKEHGYLRTYDKDGVIRQDCYYEDGKRHGQQTILYNRDYEGYVQTSNYEHGVLVGDFSELYEDGGVKTKGKYDKAGKKTGLWIVAEKDGTIEDESEYENGMRNGKRKKYFVDGTVSSIRTYKNDKLHGLTIYYRYSTHKVEKERMYADGALHGPFKDYYEDGSVEAEGEHVKGKTVYQKTYHKNGEVRTVEKAEGSALKTIEKYDSTGKSIM